MSAEAKPRKGILVVGIFLLFGASMASLAGFTLVWRGTILDCIWALNAPAYKQLSPMGRGIGLLFLLLGATLLAAALGWFQRRRWAWRLAVAIISIQVLGDLLNAANGDVLRGSVGFLIAGALLLYLLRQDVRAAFD